jgi:hypothetical protein
MSNKTEEAELNVPDNLLVSAEWEIVRQLELPAKTRELRGSKYPIHDLAINDAIVTSSKHARNIAVVARQFAKHNPGWRFITRSLGDDKTAVVRVE